MQEPDEQPAAKPPQHDPAAPHTAPFPTHIPRWVAWVLLVAFAVSGWVCVEVALR